MARIFCGRRVGGRAEVYLNGKPFDADNSLKVRNHSPDGFEWGYGGSGPAQLALAMLLVVLPRRAAEHWYQQFKFQVIARLKEEWVLTGEEIVEWYTFVRPKLEIAHEPDSVVDG